MTRRLFRRLRQDREGATTIEFGILMVPLLGAIMGFAELGYQSFVLAQLQGSLNDVARSAVVETPRIGGTGTLESRIEGEVRQRMSRLVKNGTYDFEIRSFQDFSAVNRPEALVTDRNSNGRYDAGDCWMDNNPNGVFDLNSGRSGVGGADDVVVYDVKLTAPHLFPVMAVFSTDDTFDVNASTMVRTQPYADQRQPAVAC